MRCIKYCKYIFKLVEIFPTNEDLPFRAKTTWMSFLALWNRMFQGATRKGKPRSCPKAKVANVLSQAVGRTIRPLRVPKDAFLLQRG
ncbi:MAG: hypothetical protein CK427_16675 [Leptospira sp.]|nr:MAG: hypothetical protein CK427_16675 [Leptospira sp.]